MYRDTTKITSRIIEETLLENVDVVEKSLNGLRIERLVSGKEKQQTLMVRSISKNHTQQEGKTCA